MSIRRPAFILATAVYSAGALAAWGPGGLVLAAAFLVIPMGCIWFGRELGSYTGSASLMYIGSGSPAGLLEIAGWVILLLPPVAALAALLLRVL
jgi:hypothetical protein